MSILQADENTGSEFCCVKNVHTEQKHYNKQGPFCSINQATLKHEYVICPS